LGVLGSHYLSLSPLWSYPHLSVVLLSLSLFFFLSLSRTLSVEFCCARGSVVCCKSVRGRFRGSGPFAPGHEQMIRSRYVEEEQPDLAEARRPARRRRVRAAAEVATPVVEAAPAEAPAPARAPAPAEAAAPADAGPRAAPAQHRPDWHPYRGRLLKLYAEGRLNAVDVCGLAYDFGPFAAAAGVADLARPPHTRGGHRQGGHCARQIAAATGMQQFTQDRLHLEAIPTRVKSTGERAFVPHPFALPHVTVESLLLASPAACDTYDPEVFELPCVAQDPVVQVAGPDGVVLLRVYVDGVPYQGKARTAPDSAICFYMSFVRGVEPNEPRHTITAIRKQDLCPCGCAGRCTLDAIMRTISWSFLALRAGTHPTVRADGRPLAGRMAVLAGTPLRRRGVVIHCAADWAEIVHTLGFRSSSSTEGCCFKCARNAQCLFRTCRSDSGVIPG
jgi:hypothetical protein